MVSERSFQTTGTWVDALDEKANYTNIVLIIRRFIGEEESSEGKKPELTEAPTWIIDPVDGTMNFVHSFPHSCVSIALLVNKVTEIGIIYNPMLNQKFTARRGQGAFLNGEPIRVSSATELSQALITTEFGTSREEDKVKVVLENVSKLVRLAHGLRSVGACALNMAMVGYKIF